MDKIGTEYISSKLAGETTHVKLVEVKKRRQVSAGKKQSTKEVKLYRFENVSLDTRMFSCQQTIDKHKHFTMSEDSFSQMLERGVWIKKL